MRIHFRFCAIIIALCLFIGNTGAANQEKEWKAASEALIKRVVPEYAKHFKVCIRPETVKKDYFEIETKGKKIVLTGNNPISVASALNYYLKYYCHCQISSNGDNLNMPDVLPLVTEKVRKDTPYTYRACFNYCTFSYTMPWWNWERWQREIDWMAMHGVNMPLAITGQEAVWQNSLRKFRMSDDEIRAFLVGPAYFAWQFMTNIEGWRGPLPQNWIDTHVKLGQKILERERSLGMTPILQGFTGYVPRILQEKYPEAKIKCQGDWYGVPPGPAQLDPMDPLFVQMGRTFLKEQEKLFGTDHIYAADPFHEGQPPVKGEKYLNDVGRTIYETIHSVDTMATIAMQTWSLREGIVKAIPKNKILLLDLSGNRWKKSQFWGRPWVAGIIHNFGGRVFMGGNLEQFSSNAPNLLSNPQAGDLKGIGLFPEASCNNPVIYDAASEITWMHEAPEIKNWVYDYQISRYGKPDGHVQRAWEILLQTVYAQSKKNDPTWEAAICARPVLNFKKVAPNGDIDRDYNQKELWNAWREMLQASQEIKSLSTYQYDLVDISRQCLANLSIPLQKEFAASYEGKDMEAFKNQTKQFLDLMDDMDTLLSTREEFLLGKWIADARSWGKTDAEKNIYEANARNLVTAWGPVTPQAIQYDYSNRQWSGLIKGYYKVRWQMFFDFLLDQKDDETRYSEKNLKFVYGRPGHYANDFYTKLSEWEKAWIEKNDIYPSVPVGDAVEISARLYDKWIEVSRSQDY